MRQQQFKRLFTSERQDSNLIHRNASVTLVPFNSRQKRNETYILNHLKQSVAPGSYQTNKSCFEKYIRGSIKSMVANLKLSNPSNQYQIQLQRQSLFNQSSFFKSRVNRFQQYKNEQFPGPSSYNIQGEMLKKSKVSQIKTPSQSLYSFQNQKNSRLPSIPNKETKYGYYQQPNGKFSKIQITETQLEKQRLKLKRYQQQKIQEDLQLYYKKGAKNYKNHHKNEAQSIHQKAKSFHLQQNCLPQKQQIKIIGKLKSPLKCRKQLLEKNINSQIQNEDSYVGPGTYEYNLSTLKVKKTKVQHQFFCSTQKRFPQKQINHDNAQNEELRRKNLLSQISLLKCNSNAVQINKTIKKNSPSVIRKRLRQLKNEGQAVNAQKNVRKNRQFLVQSIIHERISKQRVPTLKNYFLKHIQQKQEQLKSLNDDDKQNKHLMTKQRAFQANNGKKIIKFNSQSRQFLGKQPNQKIKRQKLQVIHSHKY